MKIPALIGVCSLSISVMVSADGRKVTFFHTQPATNEIQIGEYESFRLVSGFRANPNFSDDFFVIKEGKKVSWGLADYGTSFQFPPLELTGPAVVTLRTLSNGPTTYSGAVWITLEIQPQVFDANKAITLAPGAGAVVSLEGSTNLVNWSTTTNGIYTNLPSAMFFRIKAERLPQ